MKKLLLKNLQSLLEDHSKAKYVKEKCENLFKTNIMITRPAKLKAALKKEKNTTNQPEDRISELHISFQYDKFSDSLPKIQTKDRILRKLFQTGQYVSGFEKTVTGPVLFHHFRSIAPVISIIHPTSNKQSKQFAILSFQTPQDAQKVKAIVEKDRAEQQKLINLKSPSEMIQLLTNRHKILKTPISIKELFTKIVMKPRLVNNFRSQAENIKFVVQNYFNEHVLQREIERILSPHKHYQLLKLIFETTSHYATGFFYNFQVSHLKSLLQSDQRFKKYVQFVKSQNSCEDIEDSEDKPDKNRQGEAQLFSFFRAESESEPEDENQDESSEESIKYVYESTI